MHHKHPQMSADHVRLLKLEEKLEDGSILILKHPSERPIYDQSSKDIKKRMKNMHRICMWCKATETKETPFKACAKCQGSFYCSKECQRLDWIASHKKFCTESKKQKRLERLIGALIANDNLFGFLKIAIILRLGLHNAPRPAEPFSALVPLAVEPEDILDFARLRGDLTSRRTTIYGHEMQGMLQVGGTFPSPESPEIKQKRLDLIRELLEAHPETFTPGSLFGTVFFSMGNTNRIIEVPIVISSDLMAIAAEAQPFLQILGDCHRTIPLHCFSCIEYINTSVRRDTDNHFLLREKMTKEDAQIIQQSATNYDRFREGGFACRTIYLRIKNEYIYRPIQRDPEKEI
ncbi:hypothetical protein BDN70DRAFT_708558 [Pholiota conissans]|uniref:MYND-type domain-containing protein n=1 Tax=Pholiota conissans TaxID=109636 RepID=A0A9P5ZBE3_9AGAR|nr:hypothetical protein BDN70DRAFT_708558 [Pholiota conissans]